MRVHPIFWATAWTNNVFPSAWLGEWTNMDASHGMEDRVRGVLDGVAEGEGVTEGVDGDDDDDIIMVFFIIIIRS